MRFARAACAARSAVSATAAWTVAVAAALGGCAGGGPLLVPARTLERGDVRVVAGVAGRAAVGSLGDALQTAREQATKNGGAGTDETYARGALVAAAIAPGLAPLVGARVGIGERFEGGVTAAGRSLRIDLRRSFDAGDWSVSVGGGVSGAFGLGGPAGGAALDGVSTENLRAYGADLPLLVGWRSAGDIYAAWAGARAGWEHDTIGTLSSEGKSVTIGVSPIGLDADRFYAGGVLGLAAGFHHVHVAGEIDVAYESISGHFGDAHASLSGVSLTPGGAIWWTF